MQAAKCDGLAVSRVDASGRELARFRNGRSERFDLSADLFQILHQRGQQMIEDACRNFGRHRSFDPQADRRRIDMPSEEAGDASFDLGFRVRARECRPRRRQP